MDQDNMKLPKYRKFIILKCYLFYLKHIDLSTLQQNYPFCENLFNNVFLKILLQAWI